MANPSTIIQNGNWLDYNFRRLLQWEFFPITILIIVNLIIGLMTNHYGTGWDDFSSTFPYGEKSLSSYRTLIFDRSGDFYCSYLVSKDCYYGPAYFVLVTIIVKLAQNLNSASTIPDIWHAMNFIVFNIGIFSLYVLSRVWLTNWTSFSIAILFAAQPLLRGHGFINPKDMPFMVFFLASVTTGLVMVESFARIFNDQNKWNANYRHLFGSIWRALSLINGRKKRIYFGWFAFFVASIVLILVFLPVLNSFVGTMVEFLYRASPSTWPGAFFYRLAPHASNIPLTSYIEKSTKVMARGIGFYILLITILFLSILIYWSKAPLSALLSIFAHQTVRVLMSKEMWFAGLTLGFTSAIRVLGPYAGVIVLVYMILRLRKKSLPLILPYGMISFLFVYIFWPFLWKSPFGNFIKTAVLMSDNPDIIRVLFNGSYYPSSNLPVLYLPTLITIQITESVIVLAGIGLIYLFLRVRQRNFFLLLLITALWFLVPLVGVMIFRPALYDNFRQFLFIAPPLFLIAGMALELIFEHLKRKTFRVLFLAALVIPAIYTNMKLHPFEYVYYNSFVGGTNGAIRKFEMDYWETAYREAAEYFNATEKEGAQLVNFPPGMSIFANKNLSLYEGICTGQPLYAVISSRWNGDKTEYETTPIVHTIQRGDAALMVIRKLPCPPPPP
jgi:hypothetical protein